MSTHTSHTHTRMASGKMLKKSKEKAKKKKARSASSLRLTRVWWCGVSFGVSFVVRDERIDWRLYALLWLMRRKNDDRQKEEEVQSSWQMNQRRVSTAATPRGESKTSEVWRDTDWPALAPVCQTSSSHCSFQSRVTYDGTFFYFLLPPSWWCMTWIDPISSINSSSGSEGKDVWKRERERAKKGDGATETKNSKQNWLL